MANRIATLILMTVSAGNANAQEGVFAWRMDTLLLKNGSKVNGVLLSETRREIEFAELVRRPGKPAYALLRGISVADVKSRRLVEGKDRERLLSQFHAIKSRLTVERRQLKQIRLEKTGVGWRYIDEWFVLESDMSELVTKKCILRLDQVFRAYRQWIPPSKKRSGQAKLSIRLFGSFDEYSKYLHELGWRFRNPAAYIPRRHQVIAGSNLNRYTDELSAAEEKGRLLLARNKGNPQEFGIQLARLRNKLQEAGFSRKEINNEIALRRKLREDRISAINKEIRRTQLKNEAAFNAVTAKMFGRIRHEAFHAYLAEIVGIENNAMPRWLDEGLAQVFESSQFDGDVLRIDFPSQKLIAQLKQDSENGPPMSLNEILSVNSQSFLDGHASSQSQRSYLYSWALTEFLIRQGHLAGLNDFIERVLDDSEMDASPGARFRRLVGSTPEMVEEFWLSHINRMIRVKSAPLR